MKVLITGKNGLLAGRLKEALSAGKISCTSISGMNMSSCINDKYDYIIHAASPNSEDCNNEEISKRYVEESKKLVEAAINKGVRRFIFLSSTQVYNGLNNNLLHENLKLPEAGNKYIQIKKTIENFLLREDISSKISPIILRISNGYGSPVDKNSKCWHLLAMDVCRKAIKNGQITLNSNGEGYKDFIPITNICSSIENIMIKNIDTGIYNLATGDSLKIITFVGKIKSILEHKTGNEINININKDQLMSIEKYIYDNSKLTNILGQSTVNHQNEIDRLIDFCITHFD